MQNIFAVEPSRKPDFPTNIYKFYASLNVGRNGFPQPLRALFRSFVTVQLEIIQNLKSETFSDAC